MKKASVFPLLSGIGIGILLTLGIWFWLLYPLDQAQAPTITTETWNETYNSESRKNLISPDCQHFYDGCNSCFRLSWTDEAGCTRMACEVYEQPKCLDDETAIKNTENVASCDENNPTEQCALTPAPIHNPENRTIISREEAKNLILEGKVVSVDQTHALTVGVDTQEGEKFITLEPKIDEIFKIINECGEVCKNIRKGTE